MADRFCSVLDRVDVGLLPDGILDRLPAPGASRVGGIDLDNPRVGNTLAFVLALVP